MTFTSPLPRAQPGLSSEKAAGTSILPPASVPCGCTALGALRDSWRLGRGGAERWYPRGLPGQQQT